MKLEIGIAADGYRLHLMDYYGMELFHAWCNQEDPESLAKAIKRVIRMVSGNTVPVEITEDY